MSTRKIKDATNKQPTITKTRTKKPAEAPKNDTPKTKKVQSKRPEDDDDKIKKYLKVPLNTKKVSKPAPVKKIASTAKPPSSRPVTPPSSRVTKTQFFPSKRMYSNALIRDNKKTKETKVAAKTANDVSSDTSSMSDRPRTATLRKGSIVNKNIVGPEAPKPTSKSKPTVKVSKPKPTVKVEEPRVEYEDDFDSYESDFEEYSSDSANLSTATTDSSETESEELKSAPKRVSSAGTDDEKKLDSGNYELPESRHRQILDNIKESIEKENANLNSEHNRSNLGSLSDEGFEDGKSLQFINFLGAQKKYQHRKSVELRRKRGEEILSMIRLDQYSFTLYDVPPVPYDIFIKTFGKSNTVQASVQTGEDNLDEEVQTDEIGSSNKWTQYPPCLTKLEETSNFWGEYKCNYLGVGGDSVDDQKPEKINESRLEKFLLSAGGLILNLQAKANVQIQKSDKSIVPFSKSYVLFNTQAQDILKNRPINDVCFCPNNLNKIVTVHGKNSDENSIVCLWNLSNVEIPEMLLSAFGEVTCCTFSSECLNILFGGLSNGSIVIWDTKEHPSYHKNVYNFKEVFTRSPTYSTINYGHFSRIISIQSVTNTSEKDLFSFSKSTEICSLDQDGHVVVWSVIFKDRSLGTVVENQGLAHWGSVILTINTKISLKKLYPEIDDFNCTDLALSHFDSSNLYISTNYGIIIHCLTNGGKTSVKKFLPDTNSVANCLEMCPFSSEYFLAGFDNGDINFYFRGMEKPLMVLSNSDTLEGKSKVQKIQWSHNHPLIFYTKDVTNTVHVWNLKVNDMIPVYSVPFKDKIVCMELSPVVITGVPEDTYMMIATDKGTVYVYSFNEDHGLQPVEDFEKDKRKFLNYINRYI